MDLSLSSFHRACPVAALLIAAASLPLCAQSEDAEGCKDYPLFNRMPNFHIVKCDKEQFDQKRFPVGPPPEEGGKPKTTEVEGAFYRYQYELNEGGVRPSPLQTMRNFQAAARKAGGTILGEYPGWCKATVDESISDGNNCIFYGLTMRFGNQGKETWVFAESYGEGEGYEMWIVEREAMKQDLVVNELRDKLNQDGFIALYINFETASAAIQQDSMSQLDQVAQMLQSSPELKVEVGGHTDNVGTPDTNEKLSEARAKSVVAALVAKGVAAGRLTPKGYGQTSPVADNRTEEGRAKNRRVELVKR
jgi:outer membrane protein OmpA-like peptidoglycan-associated protein